MSFAGCLDDVSFGPVVRGCRDDFDFTLKFEKILLDLIPASVFIAASLPRLLYLLRRPIVIKGSIFSNVKLLAIACYAALQLALLAMVAIKSTELRDLFISSAAVGLLSSMCMLTLSYLEHARSLRPSILLSSYLFLTILCDTVQARTLWLASTTRYELAITCLTTVAVALKAAILFLESRRKDRWASLDLKKHSPEETTGIGGLGAYLWLSRLFLAGYRKILRIEDLYPLDSKMASEALGERLTSAAVGEELRGGHRFALARALAKTLILPLLAPIAPKIALIGFLFCQPFLINSTLSFLEKPKGERDPNVGYGLIGATILIYGGKTLSEALHWYFHERFLWMVRGALASAIYKKTTEAKINVVDDSAAITLMSTDVENVRRGLLMFHDFWTNLIQIPLASFLLYRTLGTAFAAPIIVTVACVAAASGIVTLTGQRQRDWMERIQGRVSTTANMIADMKSLKISGLVLPIQKIVQCLRLEELRVGKRFRMVQAWSLAIAYVPVFISPVITFAWASKTLSPTIMFTSYGYLLLLSTNVNNLIYGFPLVLSAASCLGRIQRFLGSEPRQDYRQPPGGGCSAKQEAHLLKPPALPVHTEKAPFLSISEGSFGWTKEVMNLSKIDAAIPAGRLTIVVGTIASGKSTLCNALLGEVPVFEGQITLGSPARRIGYCSQNPFLSNATIKQNIIGLSSLDQGRYDEVIEATMLDIDLPTLPQGDNTKVGSNGITLSGGQKQRVSLARALYLETDCFIFDDVLSGLDADTEDLVFRKVFGSDGLVRRRKATAVLCTHSIRHMASADHIIALGPDGTIIEQGTFDSLVANQKYVHSLGVKAQKEDVRTSQIASTNAVAEDVPVADSTLRARTATESQSLVQTRDAHGNSVRMNGDWRIYNHYYRSVGFWTAFALIITSIASGFFYNFQTIWINFWSTGVTAQPPTHDTAYYLGLFAMVQFLGLLSLFSCVWVGFCLMIARSGAALHQQALHTVLHAPLRFFTTTDNGVITNMFSQDMTLIDTELPSNMVSMMLQLTICIGKAAVVAASSPYLVISYPFLLAILYVIQRFYLRTSRQLRLLDLEAKSPLYTHFIDTIKGLATFRAFGWIPASVAANNTLVDTSQRPAYLLSMIQRWLAFVLDVVVAVLAIVVVTLSTQVSSGGSIGFTGASMVTLMTFGPWLAGLVRCYTTLETSLGAVSRLKAFSETVRPESGHGEDAMPDEQWPARGKIEIEGVSATYSDTSNDATTSVEENADGSDGSDGSDVYTGAPTLALRDVTLVIPAGQKVAICGRTGSGKSSLVLLLLRLLDPCSGRVRIDGVPLDGVDRNALRQRLVALPQDAVFLPEDSSFRANLDPLGAASEGECCAALRAVGLWGFVEGRGGMEAGMGPDTLSGGQKQLFSLARAVVRRSRMASKQGEKGGGGVLLLDEVSSSVDVDTERAMHAVIQRKFEGWTIVMVSHRLEMVIDFDAVVVMDKGQVVETGVPRALVEMERSRFKELWEASGH